MPTEFPPFSTATPESLEVDANSKPLFAEQNLYQCTQLRNIFRSNVTSVKILNVFPSLRAQLQLTFFRQFLQQQNSNHQGSYIGDRDLEVSPFGHAVKTSLKS